MQTNSFYSPIEVGDLVEYSGDEEKIKKHLVTNVLKDKTTGELFVECGGEIISFKDIRCVYRNHYATNTWYLVYYRMF